MHYVPDANTRDDGVPASTLGTRAPKGGAFNTGQEQGQVGQKPDRPAQANHLEPDRSAVSNSSHTICNTDFYLRNDNGYVVNFEEVSILTSLDRMRKN